MTNKTTDHLDQFADGQLCFAVRRKYKGKGSYKLLLHAAKALGKDKYAYGHGNLWVGELPTKLDKRNC